MSIVNAIYSIHNKQWLVQKVNFAHGPSDLSFIFRSDTAVTYFDHLRFGYKLKKQNTESVLSEGDFPESGEIESADQSALITIRLDLDAGVTYDLSVYAENSGETTGNSTVITVPYPEKPYESWVWQDGQWMAPVNKPSDDAYSWNETNRSWQLAPPLPGEGYFWNGESWECIMPKPEGDNWTFDSDRRMWIQG